MAKVNNFKTQLQPRPIEYGESIEEKLRRVMQSGEKIDDTAPIIYTERKDGVIPAYDIRTDRFDIAIEAMDKVHKSKIAKREAAAKAAAEAAAQATAQATEQTKTE